MPIFDPLNPDMLKQQKATPVIPAMPVNTEPVAVDELLRRSQRMLQNIQEAFLHPNAEIDPKDAKAAVVAASPLLKLILDKSPQMIENRHAIFEDAVIDVLKEADEEYKMEFLERLRVKLELQSIRLKAA